MATQAQIDANRRNAQLSTGPRTPEGKAAVSRNALKHGFRSEAYKKLLEEPQDYEELLAGLIAEYQPQTLTEEFYVERMALCLDKLGVLEGLETDHLLLQIRIGSGKEKTLSLYWDQQDRLERAFDRALTTLRKLQKERRGAESAPAPCPEQNQAPAASPQPMEAATAPAPVPIPSVASDSHAKPIPEDLASCLENNLPNFA